MRTIIAVIGALIVGISLYAQGITDSIIVLKSVEIVASPEFNKEEAGMKETKVDSLVMLKKINMSLSELLSENTPIFVKSNGRGAMATASFRGTAASHTQVTWNGMNINSPMTGSVDFSLIPVYVIDDLNLKHGTASIADNSGGLGGSININNTNSNDSTLSVKYLQGIGSYSTFNEFLQLAWGNNKLSLKSRVYHNYSKNDYTFVNKSIKVVNPQTGEMEYPVDTNDNASYKIYGILQEVYYNLNSTNTFSVKYWGQKSDRSIPQVTSYEGADNANINNQQDFDNKFVMDWTHFGENSKLVVRSGYNDKFLLYTLRNHVSGVGMIPAVYTESKIKSFANNVKYTKDFIHDISVECSFSADYNSVWSYDSINHTGYDVDRQEYSLFVSLNKSFMRRLNVAVMLRQDFVDNVFIPIVPYLGFDYKILKNCDLTLKGNAARNYHQPTLNDLYWQPGGNKDLLPEEGLSYELGLEYKLKKNLVTLKTEVTCFYSDIDNWIIWIPSFKGYWQPMNINRVITDGVEADITVGLDFDKFNVKFSGNYAYTSAKNYGDKEIWGEESYGKQLVYVPLHSANLLVNVSYKGYYITYQFNHYSERYTTTTNDVTKRDWLYPYFMSDLILGKHFEFKNFDLSAEFKIYNLLNESYHSVLYKPMPRQNYLLQLVFSI